MTTASERVLSSMNLIVSESEKNLARLKQIESQTLALSEINRETSKTIDNLDKKMSKLQEESANLKNRALKLIIDHLENPQNTLKID